LAFSKLEARSTIEALVRSVTRKWQLD